MAGTGSEKHFPRLGDKSLLSSPLQASGLGTFLLPPQGMVWGGGLRGTSLTEAYGVSPRTYEAPPPSPPPKLGSAAGGQIGANYVCPLTPEWPQQSYLTFGLLGLDGR